MVRFAYSRSVDLRSDTDPRTVSEVVEAVRRLERGGIVLSLDAGRPPVREVVHAAVRAVRTTDDVLLYVVGDGTELDPGLLSAFGDVRNVNLNTGGLRDYGFLAGFSALRSLVIQGAAPTPVDLAFLDDLPQLERLTVHGRVRHPEAVGRSSRLEFLGTTSNASLLEATAEHPRLKHLDISFGSYVDLGPLATMPSLRGVGLYRISGLTGDHLAPLGQCAGLLTLSLGALRHVNHLRALRAGPASTLRVLLLEQVRELPDLSDIGECRALTELGLYESRPRDRRLEPLRTLTRLSHLVLGDVYPREEISALERWYSGSLHYRNTIARGERRPRWRTPLDELDPGAG